MKDTANNATKNDLKDLEKKFNSRFDEVMNGIVDVMGQLQAMREDAYIRGDHIDSLHETSDDHEKRIQKLEHAKTL